AGDGDSPGTLELGTGSAEPLRGPVGHETAGDVQVVDLLDAGVVEGAVVGEDAQDVVLRGRPMRGPGGLVTGRRVGPAGGCGGHAVPFGSAKAPPLGCDGACGVGGSGGGDGVAGGGVGVDTEDAELLV